MSIVEKLTEMMNAKKAKVQDENAAAWSAYRDLILHDGELPAVELKRLAAIMEQLGIEDPAEAEFHKEVIAHHEQAQRQFNEAAPAALAESNRLDTEAGELRRELARLTMKHNQTVSEAEMARGQWLQCQAAGETANSLRAMFPGLIDGPAMPMRMGEVLRLDGPLSEKRRALGLPDLPPVHCDDLRK